MHTLLNKLTPDWRGKLASTTDLNAARRLGRKISIKSLVHNRPARYQEVHEGRKSSVVIACFGELYELEVV